MILEMPFHGLFHVENAFNTLNMGKETDWLELIILFFESKKKRKIKADKLKII